MIVVANHPQGLVDGMILAELIGKIRQDHKILTRTLLTGVQESREFMISVPFPHEIDARQKSLEMRDLAMAYLQKNGSIVLFLSGVVASVETYFGLAIEAESNPFTAKIITKYGASLMPVFFPHQNSRMYQIASKILPTIRKGLLLHEVIHACNKPQPPVVGNVIDPEKLVNSAVNRNDWLLGFAITLWHYGSPPPRDGLAGWHRCPTAIIVKPTF